MPYRDFAAELSSWITALRRPRNSCRALWCASTTRWPYLLPLFRITYVINATQKIYVLIDLKVHHTHHHHLYFWMLVSIHNTYILHKNIMLAGWKILSNIKRQWESEISHAGVLLLEFSKVAHLSLLEFSNNFVVSQIITFHGFNQPVPTPSVYSGMTPSSFIGLQCFKVVNKIIIIT